MIYSIVPQAILQKFTNFLASLRALDNMKIDPQILHNLHVIDKKLEAFRDNKGYTVENLFVLVEDVEQDVRKLVSHPSLRNRRKQVLLFEDDDNLKSHRRC
jgi:hypothetical protein